MVATGLVVCKANALERLTLAPSGSGPTTDTTTYGSDLPLASHAIKPDALIMSNCLSVAVHVHGTVRLGEGRGCGQRTRATAATAYDAVGQRGQATLIPPERPSTTGLLPARAPAADV